MRFIFRWQTGLAVLWLLLLAPGRVAADPAAPDFTRIRNVVYWRQHGQDLTLDVFKPAHSNHAGLAWMISGGWVSGTNFINPVVTYPFLQRGYTIFAVTHGSQPGFKVAEITQSIHRAIRFIRYHAADYGIDGDRLGIMGGSSGGHLSLTIVTRGGPGNPDAADPVDRESSAVECAACFFPPTDFLNYQRPGDDAFNFPVLQQFKRGLGIVSDTPAEHQKLGRELSPIYYVHSNQPPVLIIHGDADKVVPLYQSQQFVTRCQQLHDVVKLIVRPGKGHGWPEIGTDLPVFADWFDEHLVKSAAPASP